MPRRGDGGKCRPRRSHRADKPGATSSGCRFRRPNRQSCCAFHIAGAAPPVMR